MSVEASWELGVRMGFGGAEARSWADERNKEELDVGEELG